MQGPVEIAEQELVVVVVAHDRPASLQRLLNSLDRAVRGEAPPLVISIDPGGSSQEAVTAVARDHSWRGTKRVIVHQAPLGLKEHVLRCGDVALHNDAVMVLEDDLMASPAVIDQALSYLRSFQHHPAIAGISLYDHHHNETAGMPFLASDGGAGCYFMQWASSWGQIWTNRQWKAFRDHCLDEHAGADAPAVPGNVMAWPASSWKREFIRYLVAHGKYFSYPYGSLTSNCGDVGTHHKRTSNRFRSPLRLHVDGRPIGSPHDPGALRYDAYCEIEPDLLRPWAPMLQDLDFGTDLYGTKPSEAVRQDHVITTRRCRSPLATWGLLLEPIEMNLMLGSPGTGISLCRKEDVDWDHRPEVELFGYFNTLPPWVFQHLVPGLRAQLRKRLSHATGVGALDRSLTGLYDLLAGRDRG